MPNYTALKGEDFALNRNFVIDRLLNLKSALKKDLPKKTSDDNFLLATWNIREFERASFGERLPETYYYIAEIVSSFDLVAIQEVREDLAALKKLMRLLGHHWSYLVTDLTEGTQGNGERMAFVYDSRKVRFTYTAGEIVLPPERLPKKDPKNKKEKTRYKPVAQFARTPYLVSFSSGWFKFNLCTVHILYGDASNTTERVREIADVARFFKNRITRENRFVKDEDYWDRINYILLGDFNILDRDDKTYHALTKNTGFRLPEKLEKDILIGTNVRKDKFYDQIVINEKEGNACILGGGIFDYFNHVFRDEDFDQYKESMKLARKKGNGVAKPVNDTYYKKWRTYQMSDHLPMWAEFDINFSKRYLEDKRQGEI